MSLWQNILAFASGAAVVLLAYRIGFKQGELKGYALKSFSQLPYEEKE